MYIYLYIYICVYKDTFCRAPPPPRDSLHNSVFSVTRCCVDFLWRTQKETDSERKQWPLKDCC